jgi:hypothetical protein
MPRPAFGIRLRTAYKSPVAVALFAAWASAALLSCHSSGSVGGSGTTTSSSGSGDGTTTTTSVAIQISPTSATVILGQSQRFTATVTGTSNTEVIWEVDGMQKGNSTVGSVSATGLYTAPFSVPMPAMVMVTAVSKADASKSASAAVTIKSSFPVEISLSPFTVFVPVGKTQQFTATVINTSDQAVIWQVNGIEGGNSTVGKISTSGLYTAPAAIPSPAQVKVTVIPHADETKSAFAFATITNPTANNSLISGRYAFLFTGFDSGGPVSFGGTFEADGNGSLSNGFEDVNRGATSGPGVHTKESLVGTYNLGADKRGVMTLVTPLGTTKFRFGLNSKGVGTFIEFDDATGAGTRGSGVFKKQNAAAFSLSAFNGNFATGLAGDLVGSRMGVAGRFSASTSGVISNGAADVGVPGQNFGPLAVTGNLGAIDAHGRGTATLSIAGLPAAISGNLTFAYYVVSPLEALIMEIDSRGTTVPVLTGSMMKQTVSSFSNASLNGASIFTLTGFDQALIDSSMAIGQATFDAAGNVSGLLDENDGDAISSGTAFAGTYAVDATGRGTAALAIGLSRTESWTFYLIAPNKAFVLEGEPTDPSSRVQTGFVEPQSAGSFANSSFVGNFVMSTLSPATKTVVVISATVKLDGIGNFIGFVDRSTPAGLSPDLLSTGTYSVTPSGGGSGASLVLQSGIDPIPIRVVSASKFVVIAPFDAGANQGAIVVFEK